MNAQVEEVEVVNIPEIMRSLAKELPVNDFGLPTGIYRSDLLPMHLWDPYVDPVSEEPSNALPLLPEVDPASGAHSPMSLTAYNDLDDDDNSLTAAESSAAPLPLDTAAILSGQGDGHVDFINIQPKTPKTELVPKKSSEYRIAGFPADAIQQAFVPLQYDEGFPAFENGCSFWNRLDFEPGDAYQAFQRYLYLSQGKAADPEAEEYDGEEASGTRTLDALVMQLSDNLSDQKILTLRDKLKDWYHLFYWGVRARSYDLYRVTEYKQKQELRALETMDDHYVQSRTLRHRLTQYMESEDEFWDLMTPAVALKMHEHLTKLERISAGVPATGPNPESGSGAQPFEFRYRTIAQGHHEANGNNNVVDQDGNILEKALEDPASTEILQELIIKSGGG